VYGVKCSGSIADRISTHGILSSEVKIKQLILCVVYLSFRGKTSYYPTELLRLKIYTKILRSLSCPALLYFCVSLSQLLKTYWSNFQKNCIHGKPISAPTTHTHMCGETPLIQKTPHSHPHVWGYSTYSKDTSLTPTCVGILHLFQKTPHSHPHVWGDSIYSKDTSLTPTCVGRLHLFKRHLTHTHMCGETPLIQKTPHSHPHVWGDSIYSKDTSLTPTCVGRLHLFKRHLTHIHMCGETPFIQKTPHSHPHVWGDSTYSKDSSLTPTCVGRLHLFKRHLTHTHMCGETPFIQKTPHSHPHVWGDSIYSKDTSLTPTCVGILHLFKRHLTHIHMCGETPFIQKTPHSHPHVWGDSTYSKDTSLTPTCVGRLHLFKRHLTHTHMCGDTPLIQKTAHSHQKKPHVNPMKNKNVSTVGKSCNSNDVLNILSANVNGLRGKRDQVRLRANTIKPHVIACQETQLVENISCDSLDINEYKMFRNDPNENGGEVTLYVRNLLKPTKITVQINDSLELVAVKCKTRHSAFIAVSVYQPSRRSTSDFTEDLSHFVGSLGDISKQMIILGDFNVCALSAEYNQFREWYELVEMRQVIQSTTHLNTFIDHILVPKTAALISPGIDPPIENVHAQTWVKLQFEVPTSPPALLQRWNFKRTD
jgi:exonuclease III/uncharacterized Zn-finger protein